LHSSVLTFHSGTPQVQRTPPLSSPHQRTPFAGIQHHHTQSIITLLEGACFKNLFTERITIYLILVFSQTSHAVLIYTA
jgi:hypothetical protein